MSNTTPLDTIQNTKDRWMHNNKQYFQSFSISGRLCKIWFCHPYAHRFLLYLSSTDLFVLGFLLLFENNVTIAIIQKGYSQD